ncbi:hypothetical protein A2U01_0109360 [Trifolium medium]|uniref:Uncharacterized protein n=1 Tax=Trifolium medium TaxID=97028 RepID=A0A392VI59_9FABA|nr:hypothetical protein [Trifolium medium]
MAITSAATKLNITQIRYNGYCSNVQTAFDRVFRVNAQASLSTATTSNAATLK